MERKLPALLFAMLALTVAVASTPVGSAREGALEETGICVKSECTWLDNNGDIHNCETNGNVAVISGENNHVNYCHDESSRKAAA